MHLSFILPKYFNAFLYLILEKYMKVLKCFPLEKSLELLHETHLILKVLKHRLIAFVFRVSKKVLDTLLVLDKSTSWKL